MYIFHTVSTVLAILGLVVGGILLLGLIFATAFVEKKPTAKERRQSRLALWMVAELMPLNIAFFVAGISILPIAGWIVVFVTMVNMDPELRMIYSSGGWDGR